MKRRLRKIFVVCAIAIAVVFFIVSLFALFVLRTETGTNFGVQRALNIVNSLFPATIRVERVEGAILPQPIFHNVEILDADGHSIIRVRRLALALPEFPLRNDRIIVEKLTIEGGEVNLRTRNGASTFMDLAPFETAGEDDPADGAPISLPFHLEVGRLTVIDTAVNSHEGKVRRELVRATKIELHGQWHKGDADVVVDALEGTAFDGENTIEVLTTTLAASMRNSETIKARGAIATARGNVRIESSVFHISTLDGRAGVSADSHTNHWRTYLGDSLKALSAGVDVDVALKKGSSVSASGRVRLGDYSVPFNAGLQFSEETVADGHFSISSFIPAEVGIPFDANITASGDATYQSRGAAGTFDCRGCDISGFDNLNIRVNVQRATTDMIQSTVDLSRGDLKISASGSLNNLDALSVDFKVAGPVPDELEKLAGLRRIRGDVNVSGHCEGPIKHLLCTTDFTARNLQINNEHLKTIDGTAKVSIVDGKPSIQTDLALAGVRAGGLVLSKAKVSYAGTVDAGRIAAEGTQTNGDSAVINARFEKQTDRVTLSVNQISSTIGGMDIQTAAPFSVSIDKSGMKILQDGLDLQLCGGTLVVKGNTDRNKSGLLQLEFKDLNLVCLRPLLPDKELQGTVSGNLTIDRSLQDPGISLNVTGTEIRYSQAGIDKIEAHATYRENRLDGTVSIQKDETRATLDVSIAARIDLNRKSFEFLKESESHARFETAHITNRFVSMFIKIPEGLTFNVDSSGTGAWKDGIPGIQGRISGWADLTAAGRVPFSVDADLKSDEQRVRFRATDKSGLPIALTSDSRIDLNAVLLGSPFETGEVQVEGNLGSAILSLSGRASDLHNAEIAVKLRNFKLEYLAPYVPGIPIKGTLSTTLSARTQGEKIEISAGGDLTDLTSATLDLGKITFNGSLSNNLVTAALRMKLLNNDVGTLDAEIPIRTDPQTYRIAWNPEDHHRLKWRIPALDISPYRSLLNIPDILSMQIGTSGSIEGNHTSVKGSGSFSGTMTIGRKLVYDLESDFSLASQKQSLRMTLQQSGKAIATLEGAASADIPSLIARTVEAKVFPITANAKASGMDLGFINLLNISAVTNVSGTADLDLKLAGDTRTPALSGRMKINNASLASRFSERPIKELNIDVVLSPTRLKINRLEFKINDGRASVSGAGADFNLKERTLKGALRVSASRLPIELGNIPGFALSTKADIKLTMDKKSMAVDLSIGKSELKSLARIENTATKKIPNNPNVSMVDKQPEEQAIQHPFERLELTLRTKTPINVTGPSIDTWWDASLNAVSTPGGTKINGTVKSVRGTFDLLSNLFVLEHGELTLSSEPDLTAFINMDAETRLSEATVKLNVSGNLQNPNLTLSSDPARSQDQIFALLLTGNSSGDGQASGAMSAMLAMKYPVVRNFMYKKLHIDQFSMGSTAGGGTSIRLGKRISEKSMLFTIFNLNAASDENDLELKMEYALNRIMTLDTSVGDKASGIECLWRIGIKNKTPADKNDVSESSSEAPKKDP